MPLRWEPPDPHFSTVGFDGDKAVALITQDGVRPDWNLFAFSEKGWVLVGHAQTLEQAKAHFEIPHE